MLPKRSIKTIALTPLPYKFTLNEVIPMTPKQQLLQELETTPLPIILQILHFLRVLKAQKSSLDFMDFAGIAADMSEEMDDVVATTQSDRQQDLHRFYQL